MGLETGQGGGKTSLGPQKVDTGLAGVAGKQPDAKSKAIQTQAAIASAIGLLQPADEAIIRRLLLQQRSAGSTEVSAERKHWYNIGGFSLASTENTIPLARIPGGTASNTRTTNTIGLIKCKVRITIERLPTTTGTTAARTPGIRWVIWRDKVPATVGTAPTLWGTDSNPPSSTSLMFSRLGSAAVVDNQIAVFNPITAMDYHVYAAGHEILNDKSTFDFTTPATAFGIAAPQKWQHEHMIDFHGVNQNYATYAATASDINDVYITYIADIDYTNLGYSDNLAYITDCEFEDLQDG